MSKEWQVGMKAECPSGLGGTFTVKLIEKKANEWTVKCLTKGWTQHVFTINEKELRESIVFKR